jgi:isoquinoline 1-oxidoreductase subunit alpha
MSVMNKIHLIINSKSYSIQADGNMPLLWVLRDILGLPGTKYGCGIGLCGCCTVLIDGEAIKSCITPIKECTDQPIMTIEGLPEDNSHPIQQAWLQGRVSQCGYCQPSQMLTALSFLTKNPNPTRSEIADALSPVLCRCGTYPRIIKAVQLASTMINHSTNSNGK